MHAIEIIKAIFQMLSDCVTYLGKVDGDVTRDRHFLDDTTISTIRRSNRTIKSHLIVVDVTSFETCVFLFSKHWRVADHFK